MEFDYSILIANFINTVAVVALVAFLKPRSESIKALAPWVALIAGPLLRLAGSMLTELVGYPIDFGPIIEVLVDGVLSSAAAMAFFNVSSNAKKQLSVD